jgi:hypothetical protein
MKRDLKKLIRAMEKGWKLIPNMHRCMYFRKDGGVNVVQYPLNKDKIVACCAIGHALVGHNPENVSIDEEIVFSILDNQSVMTPDGQNITSLFDAITILNDEYLWDTPQIIAWLRSHL